MLKVLGAALAALVVLVLGFVFATGKSVTLTLVRPVTAIGSATTMSVQADDPHGTKTFEADVEQNGQQIAVYKDATQSPQRSRIYTFEAGK